MNVRAFSVVAATVFGAAAFADGPNEWYVDCHAAEGGDGSSASPFRNIPIAVTNAAAGDTIWVRPGVYDSGEMKGQSGSSGYVQRTRVTLTKKLFLKSTDGREVTHIVGDQGAERVAYTEDADGSKTVQCVWVGDKAAGSVVEGFTLRDGAACVNSSGGGAICCGAKLADTPAERFVVAYCTISNCVSKYGAMLHGLAVGTSFFNCYGTSGGAANDIAAYNCIVSENAGSTALYRCGPLVNCTIVNTDGSRGTQINGATVAEDGGIGSYYNCAIFANGKGDGDAYSIYRVCYTDASASSNLSTNTTYVLHGSSSKDGVLQGYEKTLMSSVGGDFRPVKDGKLDGKGDAAYLTLSAIPAEYQSRDFDGKPIESGTPIPIGAILPAAVPATAGARLNNTLKLNGREAAVRYQYHYTDTWPALMKVEGLDSQADTFLGAYADAYDTASAYTKYKGQYEHVWLMLPPLVNTNGDDLAVFTFGSRIAATTLWVDCNADYEGTADGTSERPYKTIQDAVNVLVKETWSLINVRKGVYNQGNGTKWDAAFTGKDFVARVAVPNRMYVLIRAVDGPEETVIEGAPDPNPPEEAYPGCGPNACFGVAVPSGATFGISGFTFRKCYANNKTSEVSGAAIRGAGQNQHAYDCVFTDCHAGESGSACVNNIWAVRCLFTNNTASVRGVCINGSASACLFVDNATADSSTCPFYNTQHAYGCTVYDPKASSACNAFNTNDKMIGNVFVTVGKFSSEKEGSGVYAGNVASDVLSVFSAVRDDQFIRENPFVAAPARLDCRVATNSPAIGANGGLLTERIAAGERMRYLGSDYYNNPSFAADGRFIAGAVATTYEPSTVYVDAAAGDDAKDGKTEETAKKTFAGVFAGAYCSGDTVVALPGTYATGTMDYRSYVVSSKFPTHSVKSRVVVPSGCTLVSRDGAAVTTIAGAADPEPTELGAEYGLGPNAVRCVFLDEDAAIRGFTLKDGRTDCAVEDYYDDLYGGGVLGRSIEFVRVVDCVITNCSAENGGGVGYATMDRCRVLGCYARRFGSVGRFVSAFNTYSDECFGPYAYAVYNELVNCTVGSRCVNKSGTATLPFHSPNLAGSKVWNCLYCGQESSAAIEFYKTDDKTGAVTVYADVRSSVFPKGAKFIILDEYADNVITNAVWGDIKRAYVDGKPISAEAPGVDLGTANDLMGATDRDGLQRVMNARVDVGCCEYDWRTDYARSLGKAGVTVVEVTPGVKLVDGHAVLADGDSLAVDCPTGKVGVARVVLDGTGTLKAYLNGRLVGTLTESGELKVESELDVDRLTFAYEGSGSAYVAKLSSGLGGLLIVR